MKINKKSITATIVSALLTVTLIIGSIILGSYFNANVNADSDADVSVSGEIDASADARIDAVEGADSSADLGAGEGANADEVVNASIGAISREVNPSVNPSNNSSANPSDIKAGMTFATPAPMSQSLITEQSSTNETTTKSYATDAIQTRYQILHQIFEKYEDYGVTFVENSLKNGHGNVYLYGRLVGEFIDEKPGEGFQFKSYDGGDLKVLAIYNDNGELIGVEEVDFTPQEIQRKNAETDFLPQTVEADYIPQAAQPDIGARVYETTNGDGDDAPIIKPIQLRLPPDRVYGDTLRVLVEATPSDTGRTLRILNRDVAKTSFPINIDIEIPSNETVEIKVYYDGELLQTAEYSTE